MYKSFQLLSFQLLNNLAFFFFAMQFQKRNINYSNSYTRDLIRKEGKYFF